MFFNIINIEDMICGELEKQNEAGVLQKAPMPFRIVTAKCLFQPMLKNRTLGTIEVIRQTVPGLPQKAPVPLR